MKELITKEKYKQVKRRLEELHVSAWRMSTPIFPQMRLDFKVFPTERYFSTVGQVWFVTPVWRGDAFAMSILLHEGHHWNIFPVDAFRALKEVYDARRLLAQEIGFQPKVTRKSLWRIEEDWSGFPYSIEEFSFVQNILGDYLVNLHIHDHYPLVWNDLWKFLYTEGTFYTKDKALERDTTFMLYLAVYPELIPGLKEVKLIEQESKSKVPRIAYLIKECRAGRISTTYTLKELVKLFHSNIQQDLKEEAQGMAVESDMRCPQCHSDEGWEIVEYFDEKQRKWIKL
ncbi:MAG: hypothetical protein QXP56_04545 [Archaeoglobaceae archaeon]